MVVLVCGQLESKPDCIAIDTFEVTIPGNLTTEPLEEAVGVVTGHRQRCSGSCRADRFRRLFSIPKNLLLGLFSRQKQHEALESNE
jgi:hypothetical protein